MNPDNTLNTERFLALLQILRAQNKWMFLIEDRCIHLRQRESPHIHSPITAVFCFLTGKELHRGSFWHPEITEQFGIPWWEVQEICYASIACDCGRHYNRTLRKHMLEALALSPE